MQYSFVRYRAGYPPLIEIYNSQLFARVGILLKQHTPNHYYSQRSDTDTPSCFYLIAWRSQEQRESKFMDVDVLATGLVETPTRCPSWTIPPGSSFQTRIP